MSGIVHRIGDRPGDGRAGRDIAIPQGAQGFADALVRRVEPVKHQGPRRRRLHGDLHLRQAGHHHIGASLLEPLRAPTAIDTNDVAEAASPSCLDAGERVLHDDYARRVYLEALCRFEECIGRGLTVQRQAGEIAPIHACVEQRRYPRRVEHGGAVVAGGHHRGLDLVRPEGPYKRECRVVGVDAVLRQMVQEILILETAHRVHLWAPGLSSGAPTGTVSPRDARKATTPSSRGLPST